jgi:hypothetical protein
MGSLDFILFLFRFPVSPGKRREVFDYRTGGTWLVAVGRPLWRTMRGCRVPPSSMGRFVTSLEGPARTNIMSGCAWYGVYVLPPFQDMPVRFVLIKL